MPLPFRLLIWFDGPAAFSPQSRVTVMRCESRRFSFRARLDERTENDLDCSAPHARPRAAAGPAGENLLPPWRIDNQSTCNQKPSCPVLVRASTRVRLAPRSAAGAWMAVTSPAMTIGGCRRGWANNPISLPGQPCGGAGTANDATMVRAKFRVGPYLQPGCGSGGFASALAIPVNSRFGQNNSRLSENNSRLIGPGAFVQLVDFVGIISDGGAFWRENSRFFPGYTGIWGAPVGTDQVRARRPLIASVGRVQSAISAIADARKFRRGCEARKGVSPSNCAALARR